MSRIERWVVIALVGASVAAPLGAQQTAPPPVRPLGPIVATTREALGGVYGVRPLSDGRVFVNDPVKQRVLLFDSALTGFRLVIGDSGTVVARRYPRLSALVPGRADTTVFVDQQALALVVIGPNGALARVAAIPRPSDAMALIWSPGSPAAFDAADRLVYQVHGRMVPIPGTESSPEGAALKSDSSLVVRVNPSTYALDTLAFLRAPYDSAFIGLDSLGKPRLETAHDPMPLGDDWAVVSDGSVAIVRGLDYHIDWINADGSRSTTPRIQHQWLRLDDAGKVAYIDSVKMEWAAHPLTVTSVRLDGVPHVETVAHALLIEPSALPDYRPAFAVKAGGGGNVRADADDNLWIETAAASAALGGAVYDVVNRRGELFDRVQIPGGCTIVGFGPGVVYLTSREGTTSVVAKARIR